MPMKVQINQMRARRTQRRRRNFIAEPLLSSESAKLLSVIKSRTVLLNQTCRLKRSKLCGLRATIRTGRHRDIRTASGSDRPKTKPEKRRVCQNAYHQRRVLGRSHPPPHAGCPRGDPGPLPVLMWSTLCETPLRIVLARWNTLVHN